MALYLYYALMGAYGILLLVSIGYYSTRKAPGGDAAVGWAMGLFFTAGLAVIVLIAVFLRNTPTVGILVLSLPLVYILRPRIKRFYTKIFMRFPVYPDTPPLNLFIENNTDFKLHIKLECWFGPAKSHQSTLGTTLDYYVQPLEKTSQTLDVQVTRLLAYKCKYVSVVVFQQVEESFQVNKYITDIQPCFQIFDEQPEAFRTGNYTVRINPK